MNITTLEMLSRPKINLVFTYSQLKTAVIPKIVISIYIFIGILYHVVLSQPFVLVTDVKIKVHLYFTHSKYL